MKVRLEDRYTAESGDVQMTGVQALARLPLNILRSDRTRGMQTAVFISGYEGSPLGGYDLELQHHAELLAEYDLVFQPGVNEELAATSVQGTQLAAGLADARVEGVTGFWYGKSPGLDRASDALRHANLMGTHPKGGAVAFVGDDPGAKSSTVPGASEFLLADLGMPVLYPADPQDVLDLGVHAVAMSRLSGLWVALKIATNVADGSGTVEISSDRVDPQLPLVMFEGQKFEHRLTARMLQPALSEMERTREGVRLDAARAYALANRLNRSETFGPRANGSGASSSGASSSGASSSGASSSGASSSGASIGIVAAGKTYLDMRQALRTLGLDEAELRRRDVRLLRLAMIHPLIASEIEEFADGLDEIIVVEEKRPFIESAVKEILYGVKNAPKVTGKTDPEGAKLFAAYGELDADLIAAGLARILGRFGEFTTVKAWQATQALPRPVTQLLTQLPLVSRTPYFCSGCPHNSSTKVPEGSLVGGGIGCHALVLMMEPEAVGDVVGLTQMGGEGAQWIGMAPFMRTRRHLLQNIGDGTFHHSGSLAVRAAVASGVNVTYKLLYNSAVAMTGGQQAVGAMSIPALTKMLTAEGVRRIVITTAEPKRYRRADLAPIAEVWHRDRVVAAQEVLSQVEGVTVLIHDQECATELRRKRKRRLAVDPTERVMINQRVCEGCGDCGEKSNCLSVQPVDTEFGRKTVIDQSSCNKDYSCLKGDCPSFLTVVPSDKPRARRATAPALASDAIGDPPFRFDVAAAPHTTRITGVGGTGVVTLSQVLSTAGRIAGRQVRSLDQTGLAQKGGAVISDIKISADEIEQSHKAVAGECGLYLGCDLLVAADAKNLAVADPQTTIAVVSTTKVPTGKMVVDTTVPFPDVEATTERIKSATRGAESVFVDARGLSVTLLGTDQFANMLLAGVAFQTGALPLPAWAIEQAIELNGVQVEPNLQAFRRGRQRVAEPAAFAQTVAALTAVAPVRVPTEPERRLIESVGAAPGSELHRIVATRIPDLIGYQNVDYARRYADIVAKVREAEDRTVPGESKLSEAVAEFGYKLMAYKDEYEVARLLTDPQAEALVRAEFGVGARVSYRLHPPILRALGMKQKLKLGPWSRPGFQLLRAGKIVRGTKLDPFGHTQVRRVERELIDSYTATIDDLLGQLSTETYQRAVEIARLPDLVRGYETIKLANVALYRARVRELQNELATVSS